MNCGLGNLEVLKRHLLAGSMQSNKRFDQTLIDIGLGIAGMFEQLCNRQFARMENDQAVFQADRASFILPRYPVESISLVELKGKDLEGWVPQDADFIQSTSPASGIVYLPDNVDAARYWSQVRFTYTGGFWFETAEPDDQSGAYPSQQPAGSKALPYDLRFAWLIQCREVWNKFDKLGAGLVDEPNKQTLTGALDISPIVKKAIANYVQMQPI